MKEEDDSCRKTKAVVKYEGIRSSACAKGVDQGGQRETWGGQRGALQTLLDLGRDKVEEDN